MAYQRKYIGDQKSPKSPTIMDTLSKSLTAEAEWLDKDEFLDVIYWLRQIMGVCLGIIWGVLHIKGVLGLVGFLAVNTIITYVYFNAFQKVDEEEYGGITEILKEGLMTSFSSFLVAWIIVYSAVHFD